jgi:bifunctional enzyme CysN/CysC
MVASGSFRAGDEVMVLPSAKTARIVAVGTYDGPLEQAGPGESVVVRLDRDIDISRGDMLCRPNNQATVSRALEAQVSWMNERPLRPGARYALKHTTRWARAIVDELRYRIDVNTLHRDDSVGELALNQIGRVSLRTSVPIVHDAFHRNRTTGGFILVDEDTNETLGAGMIVGDYR